MCHYITAVLPHTVDPTAVASLFDSYKLGFEIISNPHVVGQIDLKAWYILTSGKHCDCGTALGSLTRQARAQGLSYDREVEKFRKQGWSEAKIKRWLEQKEQTQERHRREDEALAEDQAEDRHRVGVLDDLGLVPAPEQQPVQGRRRDQHGRAQRGADQDEEVHVLVEARDPVERLRERHGEQEPEQDLHARRRDADLLEEFQQPARVAL